MTPTKLGPYPIEREVGRGGMGVVYLGRDTRLERAVAIKVLPDGFAHDPERLSRFEREARLLASLTHPNIAGIYGIEEDGGKRFLALEYVPGETLAEHIARGPLPQAETLDVCRQIASALEAAHEAGIVHRDLKPGNVKITPTGEVKVLDFGLAKGTLGGSDSSFDLSQSPTMTRAATGMGVILGTAAYMSPEQARGKPVDRRTDIWSFGCVLYECLTGAQAFAGETVSDMIALILQGEPDWSRLPAATPEKLRMLLARCLEKDARRRLRDIGDARIEIEELLGGRAPGSSGIHRATSEAAAPAVAPAPARSRWRAIAGGGALVIAGALAPIAAWYFSHSGAEEMVPARFAIQAPPHTELFGDSNEQVISPDGRILALVASDSSGEANVWLRPLDSFDYRMLPGTKGADLPFWSPDGKQIGFFADAKLKRIRIAGGPPEVICPAPSGRGASWSPNGTIVFAPAAAGPLCRVRAAGGDPEAVTRLDSTAHETAHRWPSFWPDGDHFTYAAIPAKNSQFVTYVASLRSGERVRLLEADTAPIYAPPGFLVFTRGQSLVAQRLDVGRRHVTGDPFPIGEPPLGFSYLAAPGACASRNGVLSWQSGGNRTSRVAWVDRQGREVGRPDIPTDRWAQVSLSPDGRRVALEKTTDNGIDLWVADVESGNLTRLTHDESNTQVGAWSPDGQYLVYASNRLGQRNLYVRPADGSGSERLLYQSNVPFKDLDGWSPDGKWILFQELGATNGWDLMMVPAGGGTPVPYLATPFNEQNATISPDGRWVSYVSDESGTPQAYVQSFPTPGHKQPITKSGVFFTFWGGDGRQIFVLRSDATMLSVPVTSGPEPHFGQAEELYKFPQDSRGWNPARDGRKFLMTLAAEKAVPGISVAINWRAGRQP